MALLFLLDGVVMLFTEANAGSFLRKINPRIKILAVFSFIAITSSLNSLFLLLSAVFLVTASALFSGIPVRHLLFRTLVTLPFIGFVLIILPFTVPGEPALIFKIGAFILDASRQGLHKAVILGLRVVTAVLSINTLTISTSLPELMDALRSFRVPGIFVQILEFSVRYIFVLADEAGRMRIARKSRGFEPDGNLFNVNIFRVLGQLVAVLFARSWERGERIYFAMLSRGYSSETCRRIKPSKIQARDLLWGASVVAVAVCLRLMENGIVYTLQAAYLK